MDNKLLIGFLAFLFLFLAFPIIMNQMKQAQTPEQSASPTVAAAAAPAENPEMNQPPLWNEQNLTGTSWIMPQGEHQLTVTLAAGGVLYITHPLAKALTGMDYLEGRWRVNYDQAQIFGKFGGQEYSYNVKISGTNLYYTEGSKVIRIQQVQ